MIKSKFHFYLLFLSIKTINTCATSIVYNFRIAQVTKQPFSDVPNSRNNSLMGLLFNLYQKKYTQISQNFTGGLITYIRDWTPYYLRIDAAMSHIKQIENHLTTFTGKELDDILFTGGCKLVNNARQTISVSGLFGIPTHSIKVLQHATFGYSQVGIGAQLDSMYNVSTQNAFVYGLRYIYFIPRNAEDNNHNLYKFSMSNVFDILIADKYNWGKQGLELGYTARFQFGAQIYPDFSSIINRTNCIRNSFYLVYKYKFLLNETPNRLLLNIGYGFDHKPKDVGNKDIVTIWASWTVNF